MTAVQRVVANANCFLASYPVSQMLLLLLLLLIPLLPPNGVTNVQRSREVKISRLVYAIVSKSLKYPAFLLFGEQVGQTTWLTVLG